MSLALGIDLGGTNTKLALVDRSHGVLVQQSIPTRAETGPGAVVMALAQTAEGLLTQARVDRAAVQGIGLATPGPLDLGAGKITRAANLPGWQDGPVRDMLAECVGLPVVLENDANAAAYGEYVAGGGVGCEHLVVLTLGTGVGSGVIVNGEILHGHFDNAGELGHMIVVVDGLPCPCGQRGCLERYSSADAIVRRVREGHKGSRGREIEGSREWTAPDIAHAASQQDPVCARIWDEACKYLAVACVNIQHAYNPQRILLAGGLSLAGDLLLEPVRRHLKAQSWSLHTDLPEVAPATLGSDAGVIGAAALAFAPAE